MLTFRDYITPGDIEAVRNISASTGVFDSDDTEITVELARDALTQQQKGDDEIAHDIRFLFAEQDGQTCAYACYGHIADSDSTYELYWLSTHNDYRGQGIGKKLITRLIEKIQELGGSKLYIKTDGKDLYKPTRCFYDSCGFTVEARLKQYYDKNDDCYIYSMCL